MRKAKTAVQNILSKDGKHDTTVHETVNPAVEHERVTRTQLEEAQRVIDREVHQDHYHTSVQPILHKEVLPEEHRHNMLDAETREHHHGNPDHIKQRLEAEAAQFKSHREVGDVQRSTAEAPTVAGEHIHHHVHETIQPVIQKETIQPSVVHTTIPVHEIHHNEAKHHAVSTLPAMSMSEFQSSGGALDGREERSDAFAGEPRAVGSTLASGGSHYLGGPGAAGTTSVTDGNMGEGNMRESNLRGGNIRGGNVRDGDMVDDNMRDENGKGVRGRDNTIATTGTAGTGVTTSGSLTGTNALSEVSTDRFESSGTGDNNDIQTGTKTQSFFDKINPLKT